jgi:hypothetical protein
VVGVVDLEAVGDVAPVGSPHEVVHRAMNLAAGSAERDREIRFLSADRRGGYVVNIRYGTLRFKLTTCLWSDTM